MRTVVSNTYCKQEWPRSHIGWAASQDLWGNYSWRYLGLRDPEQDSAHLTGYVIVSGTLYRQVCTQLLPCIAPPVLEHMYSLAHLLLGSRADDALFICRSKVQLTGLKSPKASHFPREGYRISYFFLSFWGLSGLHSLDHRILFREAWKVQCHQQPQDTVSNDWWAQVNVSTSHVTLQNQPSCDLETHHVWSYTCLLEDLGHTTF